LDSSTVPYACISLFPVDLLLVTGLHRLAASCDIRDREVVDCFATEPFRRHDNLADMIDLFLKLLRSKEKLILLSVLGIVVGVRIGCDAGFPHIQCCLFATDPRCLYCGPWLIPDSESGLSSSLSLVATSLMCPCLWCTHCSMSDVNRMRQKMTRFGQQLRAVQVQMSLKDDLKC
jgi:hypothetical protein